MYVCICYSVCMYACIYYSVWIYSVLGRYLWIYYCSVYMGQDILQCSICIYVCACIYYSAVYACLNILQCIVCILPCNICRLRRMQCCVCIMDILLCSVCMFQIYCSKVYVCIGKYCWGMYVVSKIKMEIVYIGRYCGGESQYICLMVGRAVIFIQFMSGGYMYGCIDMSGCVWLYIAITICIQVCNGLHGYNWWIMVYT